MFTKLAGQIDAQAAVATDNVSAKMNMSGKYPMIGITDIKYEGTSIHLRTDVNRKTTENVVVIEGNLCFVFSDGLTAYHTVKFWEDMLEEGIPYYELAITAAARDVMDRWENIYSNLAEKRRTNG